MDLSLSIVLPVHNAQHTLEQDIHHLLDLLPDITARFEILIVDNASTDQTEEIAHVLSHEYPQVRVTRNQTHLGTQAAVQTAVSQTAADVVLVQEEGTEIRSTEILRLWELRHDQQLIMARAELPRRALNPHLLERLASWGEQLQQAPSASASGGIQMIRREAVEELAQPSPKGPLTARCPATESLAPLSDGPRTPDSL